MAFFLLIALQAPLFSKWGSVAYFQMNREFIAKNLCVNKNKPKMNCNGQCYLAKQLKSAEDKETKSNSEKLEKMPELVLFLPIHSEIPFKQILVFQSENNFNYSNHYTFQFSFNLNQPPAIS